MSNSLPLRVYNGTEWVNIGVQSGQVLYQNEQPASPQTGSIWIDSDDETSVLDTNDFLTINSASTTYLTQTSASATYLTQTSASATYATLTISLNAKTDNYTFILSDAGKLLTMSSGSTRTFTIPPDNSVAFPVGTAIGVAGLGAGLVQIRGDSGVTINSVASTTPDLTDQYAAAQCYKIDTNTWLVIGNIE
jgi:hypothetical protein